MKQSVWDIMNLQTPNIVNIIQVNSILVNLDIISGSYVNGSASPTIYSFYPNVSPGYKIVERPSPSLVFYPVSRNENKFHESLAN